MSMMASFPGGLRRIGWLRIGLTAAAFSLHLRMEGLATFALVSPLMSVPIWTVIALGSVALLKLQSFGWLPAAVLGIAVFGVLSRTDIGPISLPFGAASALLYRMALALQRPEAF